MQHDTILVVGAGPTGLVLALSLARRGVKVRIIDKNSGPAQASRAMVVHARNLEFYRQLGFADEVVGQGLKMDRVHLRERGREAASFALGDIGRGLSPFPFLLCYPQDDHERLLGAKLREAGVEVEWNTALTGLEQDADGVEAQLERDGRRERARAPYLFGADGAHSAVRHALGIGFPGGDYDQVFYVADVATEAGGTDMLMTLDVHGFGLYLPVRSSGMQRLIGLVPPELAGRHDLTFDEIRPRAEQLTGLRVKELNWFSLYHVHHRVAAHFRVGRCFIGGDAGHIHSPVGGQGMNTGIGDAINLAWKLADVLRGRAGPQILDSYEPERIAYAHTLVATTDRLFQRVIGQGIGSELFRTVLMPHIFPLLTGFSAVRRAMFRAVSQVRIAYRDSALSRGRAGSVAGGDRLPWVADVDNFVPLRSLDWQVHIYGDAKRPMQDAAGELGLEVHAFPWTDAAHHAGFKRDAAYLVRPDGHVGLADPKQDPAALRDYARSIGLRPADCQPRRKLA
jgi:2-polyprenyl-6-methoxyphenol hydroxylase-like FAD-dependent oxidoreductase